MAFKAEQPFTLISHCDSHKGDSHKGSNIGEGAPDMTPSTHLDILLVEDEPADAYLIQLAFDEARLPVTLHQVQDGEEALTFLRHEHPYLAVKIPDLILLDLNLPRMNGRTFLQTAKADPKLRHIPTIVLSTSDMESDVHAAYAHHAAGYLVKPMHVEAYMAMLQGFYQYWAHTVRLMHSSHAAQQR